MNYQYSITSISGTVSEAIADLVDFVNDKLANGFSVVGGLKYVPSQLGESDKLTVMLSSGNSALYIGAGFGDALSNGNYILGGTLNGHPYYVHTTNNRSIYYDTLFLDGDGNPDGTDYWIIKGSVNPSEGNMQYIRAAGTVDGAYQRAAGPAPAGTITAI